MALIRTELRTLALAGCVALAAGTGATQTAAPVTAPEPIIVEETAPPGGSAQIAVGAGVGVLVGLAVLILVFSSGG